MKNNLTFWISIGSTYTYLTALRLSKFIRDNDFDISFKIINIRWIMKKMDNVPFPPSKPSKVNYMWKDIQRRAEIYQIPIPKIPAPYPLKYFDEANLYALTALEEGSFVQYLENTYRYWFLEEIPAGSDENIKLVCSINNIDFIFLIFFFGTGQTIRKFFGTFVYHMHKILHLPDPARQHKFFVRFSI